MNAKKHFTKKKLLDVAQNFYGFGNWNAKYVLIGLELGGIPKDFTALYEFLSKSKENGKLPELVDFIEYMDFVISSNIIQDKKEQSHGWYPCKTQPTYSPILKSLKPFKRKKVTGYNMKVAEFGKISGDYLAIDLSTLPCKGNSTKDFEEYAEKLGINKDLYHLKYFYPRIETIAKKLNHSKIRGRKIIIYGARPEIYALINKLTKQKLVPLTLKQPTYTYKKSKGTPKIIHIYHPSFVRKKQKKLKSYWKKVKAAL